MTDVEVMMSGMHDIGTQRVKISNLRDLLVRSILIITTAH